MLLFLLSGRKDYSTVQPPGQVRASRMKQVLRAATKSTNAHCGCGRTDSEFASEHFSSVTFNWFDQTHSVVLLSSNISLHCLRP